MIAIMVTLLVLNIGAAFVQYKMICEKRNRGEGTEVEAALLGMNGTVALAIFGLLVVGV